MLLTAAEKHQLRIAKDTLNLSEFGARFLGGMTHDEAKAVILRLTGKPAKESER